MSLLRLLTLTVLALLAFAGNSLLCRAALRDGGMDAASFTFIRIFSGTLLLWILLQLRAVRDSSELARGSWFSALALFGYAAGFSFAYLSLSAATGALLLFGAVQVTMIGHGVWSGEQLRTVHKLGLLLAFAGLVTLLLPGLSAPPWRGALLMLGAGAAWGIYSLRGRGSADPILHTAGNFLRALPMTAILSLALLGSASVTTPGVIAALASGALASGLGYAIWYTVLPSLRSTSAAVVQLSVPILAALGGILWLAEPITWRFMLAAAAVLGGIALVTVPRRGD
jgi:drug/metabolite transporter (DMT)-like permease